MSRKALPSILLHKSEVTYRDTGVSKKDNNWSYLLYKTKFCFLSNPHKKISLNKNMPNYNRFHVNCYLKATCNIL